MAVMAGQDGTGQELADPSQARGELGAFAEVLSAGPQTSLRKTHLVMESVTQGREGKPRDPGALPAAGPPG